MRLFSIMLFKWSGKSEDALRLAQATELSEFGYFKRDSIKEVLTFVSRSVVSRSVLSEKSSVAHEDYVAHVRVTAEKLACVVITDKEYPSRVAFDVIQQSLAAFKACDAAKNWESVTVDKFFMIPSLDSIIKKYQKPQEIDTLLKIQKDIDNTKTIMFKNLDNMLERNEKLEDLVRKSNDLSIQSKTFVKHTHKLNACC